MRDYRYHSRHLRAVLLLLLLGAIVLAQNVSVLDQAPDAHAQEMYPKDNTAGIGERAERPMLPPIEYEYTEPVNELTEDPERSPEVAGVGGFTPEELAQAQREAEHFPEPVEFKYSTRAVGERAVRCKRYAPFNIEVCGAILDKYESLGEVSSPFLWPVEPMALNPDGRGYRIRLANGFIYWSPETGAHAVPTHVALVWGKIGWEKGPLGYPTTDQNSFHNNELTRMQRFEHGAIVQTEALTNSAIWGEIYSEWLRLGGVDSPIGLPLSSELPTPENGRYNLFEHGMITWNVSARAHAMNYEVAGIWFAKGAERDLGLPVESAISQDPLDRELAFEHGTINLARPKLDSSNTVYNGQTVANFNADLLGSIHAFLDKAWNTTTKAVFNNSPAVGRYRTMMEPMGGAEDDELSIPSRYIYDTSLEPKSLHDYCTLSPDAFYKEDGSEWPEVSLRGVCARHDLCYEDSGYDDPSYVARGKRVDCDDRLHENIKRAFRKVGDRFIWTRYQFRVLGAITARVYYAYVVQTHEKAYPECPAVDARNWYFQMSNSWLNPGNFYSSAKGFEKVCPFTRTWHIG